MKTKKQQIKNRGSIAIIARPSRPFPLMTNDIVGIIKYIAKNWAIIDKDSRI